MVAGRKKIVIDSEKLMLLRDGGLSNEEIAAAFKCSVPTVANRTRELQLQGLIEYKRRTVKSVKHIRRDDLSEASAPQAACRAFWRIGLHHIKEARRV